MCHAQKLCQAANMLPRCGLLHTCLHALDQNVAWAMLNFKLAVKKTAAANENTTVRRCPDAPARCTVARHVVHGRKRLFGLGVNGLWVLCPAASALMYSLFRIRTQFSFQHMSLPSSSKDASKRPGFDSLSCFLEATPAWSNTLMPLAPCPNDMEDHRECQKRQPLSCFCLRSAASDAEPYYLTSS